MHVSFIYISNTYFVLFGMESDFSSGFIYSVNRVTEKIERKEKNQIPFQLISEIFQFMIPNYYQTVYSCYELVLRICLILCNETL